MNGTRLRQPSADWIERIVLRPGADGLHVTLQGDFGAILEWPPPAGGMSVSAVAGEGFEPPTHGL